MRSFRKHSIGRSICELAHDSLDLGFPELVANKAGMAECIVKPAFAMYRADRAVRIGDAVAFSRIPRFGLPAGCPFATLIMALVTHPWRKQLRSIPSQPSVRTWVDDCAPFAQGNQAAVGMAE